MPSTARSTDATLNFLNFVSSFFVRRYYISLYVPTSGKMSLSAVDPSAPAPDWDIEWPDFSPPPAAPTPPPLPEVVQFDLLSPPSRRLLLSYLGILSFMLIVVS
jgi:hypothetical protein